MKYYLSSQSTLVCLTIHHEQDAFDKGMTEQYKKLSCVYAKEGVVYKVYRRRGSMMVRSLETY